MKKIITFFIILILSAHSTHLFSFQKAKGALLLGLSAYCYTQLPYWFSWVKHPGKQYGHTDSFQEFSDGSALWTVNLSNSDGQEYRVTVPLVKKNVPGMLQEWGKSAVRLLINDFFAHGVSPHNTPGFTIHVCTNKYNQCVIQLQIDTERVIIQHVTSRHYIVDKDNVVIKKIPKPLDLMQWFTYNAHASALGLHNICRLGCILVGSYGCAKMTGIV